MEDDTLSSMKELTRLVKIDSVIALYYWVIGLASVSILLAKSLHFLPAWDQKIL